MSTYVACCSHSPMMVMGLDQVVPGEQDRYHAAMASVAAELEAYDPELIVVFYPDHFIGFPLDLIPPFCVGINARSAEEFGIAEHQLDVPQEIAGELVEHLQGLNFDVAFSHNMTVDHGATLTLTQLLGDITRRKVLPILVNCTGGPRPSFRRVRQLGTAVGSYFASAGIKVAVLGSGGLSHDSPSSRIAKRSPERFLRANRRTPEEQRQFELDGAENARRMLAGDVEASRPPNQQWDEEFLRMLLENDVEAIDGLTDDGIDTEAGGGTHEVRTWVAAAAAGRALGALPLQRTYYALMSEWITGMGIVSNGARALTATAGSSVGAVDA